MKEKVGNKKKRVLDSKEKASDMVRERTEVKEKTWIRGFWERTTKEEPIYNVNRAVEKRTVLITKRLQSAKLKREKG